MMLEKFELLILKNKALLLHVPGIYVHGNITVYYVHIASCIVGVCEYDISNKMSRKVCVM